MQKSTKREILWLQNADSKWFESVYFILKPGAEEDSAEEDMLKEADRIVAAALSARRGRKRRAPADASERRFRRGFLVGGICGALLPALAALAYILFA